MLRRIYFLIIKELLILVRNPRNLSILVGPPLIQLIIFSYAITLEVKNIDIAIFNQDTGVYANELVQRFVGSTNFKNIIFVNNAKSMEKLIDTQKVLVGIHIEQDFSKHILSGKSGVLQVIVDGRNSNSAQIISGYINNITESFSRELAIALGKQLPNSIILVRNWFNPNLEYQWFTVPGILGILLTIMGIIITGLSVAREREMGTFDQLLVSPLRPVEILLGKTIPSLIVGLLQGTLLFVVSIWIFRIHFVGSIFYLYLAMIVYLLSVIGVGLFISSIVNTQQQAILGAFVFAVPAILLSGFATPIENMPYWLQIVSMTDPVRYFLVLVKGIYLKDISFNYVFVNITPLFCIGLITMSIAVWFFRRRVA